MRILSLAGCIIADGEGRILLLHRSTPALTHWELPGGKLEKGESAEVTALRETEEETSVKAKSGGIIGQTTFTDSTGTWHYIWVRAEITKGKPRICEPDKFDNIGYFDLFSSDLEDKGISANLVNLRREIQAGVIKL